MIKHYVDSSGNYVGAFVDGAEPDDHSFISLGENSPNFWDQVWQFPGWSDSPSQSANREGEWRDTEMPKAQQNVTAIEYGEGDIPGTAQQWQKYWLALRKWTDTNPDFPDSSKRPVAPT